MQRTFRLHIFSCTETQIHNVPASVAQSDTRPSGDPPPSRHSFVEIDHDIFSTAILTFPLVVSFWRENVLKDWLNVTA